MQLTDGQLNHYVDEVLAFGAKDKEKYQPQVDHLKQTLTNKIHENSALRVAKIKQAGSWRKGTALKPRDGFDIDIDLVVYLDVSESARADLPKMHDLIIALLCAAYPNKQREDFKPSKKTVGIVFHTSGLKVDLVPVVPIKEPVGYVWQPEVGGGGAFLTCPDGQLELVRALKDRDPRFASVVRLLKKWRNVAELSDELSSFTIELIAAHVVERQGPPPSLEEGLLRVLSYVAESRLASTIAFKGAIRQIPSTSSLVRICDPTNNENNVTEHMSGADRQAIVGRAGEALEALNHAQTIARVGDTLDRWREVFGPTFKTEEG